MSIGSFPHKAETLIIFTPHSFVSVRKSVSPSRGARGTGLVQGFVSRFGARFGSGVFGVACVIYLPFWYVGCQMRLEPVFLIFGKPRGILYFIVEHV